MERSSTFAKAAYWVVNEAGYQLGDEPGDLILVQSDKSDELVLTKLVIIKKKPCSFFKLLSQKRQKYILTQSSLSCISPGSPLNPGMS